MIVELDLICIRVYLTSVSSETRGGRYYFPDKICKSELEENNDSVHNHAFTYTEHVYIRSMYIKTVTFRVSRWNVRPEGYLFVCWKQLYDLYTPYTWFHLFRRRCLNIDWLHLDKNQIMNTSIYTSTQTCSWTEPVIENNVSLTNPIYGKPLSPSLPVSLCL